MLRYRELLKVEDIFRTTKAILDTRPIYHQKDATIRGHVFCSFLALVLRKALEDRLAAARMKTEWGALIRELDRLQEVETEQDGKRFILRTPVTGDVGRAFQAVGVALHAQRAVTIFGFDVAVPQARVFQHMAVGIDGAPILQMMNMLEMMNRTGIEYRSHYRSSPAIRP